MRKTVFAVVALIIAIGIIIIATIGFNVDIVYSKHSEARVYIGKEYNNDEINQIVKEVMQDEKVVINKIEKFNDSFVIKAKNISNEQVESLKQKIGEKYEIEDTTSTVTLSKVGGLRIRDLIKPYIVPVILSSIIILAYMGVKYKKFGAFRIAFEEGTVLIITGALFLSIMAITRCPINRLFIPAGLAVYILTVVATNIQMENFSKKMDMKKDQKA